MLVAETRNHIQYIVNKFEMGCGRMRLKINVGKSKMLEVNKDQRRSGEKVWVNWEEMETRKSEKQWKNSENTESHLLLSPLKKKKNLL